MILLNCSVCYRKPSGSGGGQNRPWLIQLCHSLLLRSIYSNRAAVYLNWAVKYSNRVASNFNFTELIVPNLISDGHGWLFKMLFCGVLPPSRPMQSIIYSVRAMRQLAFMHMLSMSVCLLCACKSPWYVITPRYLICCHFKAARSSKNG